MEHTSHTDSLAFLKAHTLGALSTTSPSGDPHVRVLYYAADDAYNLYFLSLANTRKVEDIRANQKAAFVVISDDTEHTLQIEGVFEEMTDTATFGPVIVELTRHLFPEDQNAAPITHLDPSRPVFFKLKPTWIRWGDFSKGNSSNQVFTEVTLAQA